MGWASWARDPIGMSIGLSAPSNQMSCLVRSSTTALSPTALSWTFATPESSCMGTDEIVLTPFTYRTICESVSESPMSWPLAVTVTSAFSPRSSRAFSLLKSRWSIDAASPNHTEPLRRLMTAMLPPLSTRSPLDGRLTADPSSPVVGLKDWIWFDDSPLMTTVRPSCRRLKDWSATLTALDRSLIWVLTVPSRPADWLIPKMVPSWRRTSATRRPGARKADATRPTASTMTVIPVQCRLRTSGARPRTVRTATRFPLPPEACQLCPSQCRRDNESGPAVLI
jgi:hypothetical protein